MEKLVSELKKLLANNYVLFLKTQNYHWNVEGKDFAALHIMFEGQYNDLFMANDAIAEKIRMLGFKAPATYKEYLEMASIKEGNSAFDANAMVKDLLQSNRDILKMQFEVLKLAQDAGVEGVVSFMSARIEVLEKVIWFFEMSLK